MPALGAKPGTVFLTQSYHRKIDQNILAYSLGQIDLVVCIDGEHFVLFDGRQRNTRYHVHCWIKALFEVHVYRLLEVLQAACTREGESQIDPAINQKALVD